MDTVAYWALPVIGPTLRSLNVKERESLLSLNLSDISSKPGIGKAKICALIDLIKAESSVLTSNKSTPNFHGMEEYRQKCKAYLNLPISSTFGRINPRLKTKIIENELGTVGQLIDWADSVDFSREANYGRGTHQWLKDTLGTLASEGSIKLVFGTQEAPQNIDDLVTLYVNSIDKESHRKVFIDYFENDFTLDEIGKLSNPPVTRERIRQIIDRNFEHDRESWGPTTSDLLEPLYKRLSEQNGCVTINTAKNLTGASSVWQIELAARLSGNEIYAPRGRREGIITTHNNDSLQDLSTEVSGVVEDLMEATNESQVVHDALKDYGIDFGVETRQILTILNSLTYNGDYVYGARRKINSIYVESLRKFGSPATAQEITDLVLKENPDFSTSPHTTIAQFRRAAGIYKTDDHKFCHESNLGYSVAELKSLAKEAYKLVPKNGQAVNVRRLLAELSSTMKIPDGLSPYTLRDAMMNLGNVRSWRAGCDVAWICDNTNRSSIVEFISEIAPTLPQPFNVNELVDSVCKISGYLKESVPLQLHGSDSVVLIGYATYLSREVIEKDQSKFMKMVDMAASYIPVNGVITSDELDVCAKEFKSLTKKYGAGVVWGLARLHPDVKTRIRGRVAYRSSGSQSLWHAFRNDKRWNLTSVFTSEQLKDLIVSGFKIKKPGFSTKLLGEAIQNGIVFKNATQDYVDSEEMSKFI